MATHNGANIKDLLRQHPRKVIVTAKELLRIGISREQQRSLLAGAWLRRVGTGAYAMLDDEVNLVDALYALQRQLGFRVPLFSRQAVPLHGL